MAPTLDILTQKNFANRVRDLAAEFVEFEHIVKLYGIPPLWSRPPGFDTLVRIILEQQVSLLSGKAAYDRIVEAVDIPAPASIVAVGETGLRSVGITRQKSRYLTILAETCLSKELDLISLTKAPDETVFKRLTSLTGIGPWTANVYLLSALRRADVWPKGDVTIVNSIRTNIPLPPEELFTTGNRWNGHRSIAARLLWHWYLCQPGREAAKAEFYPV